MKLYRVKGVDTNDFLQHHKTSPASYMRDEPL